MHARRMTTLLLIALLTSGCVAVPHGPAPAPPARSGGLAPAADRPPAPLPAAPPIWPAPTEPAPREALTVTDPRPAPEPTRAPDRKAPDRKAAVAAAEAPAARRPRAQRPAPNRPHTKANKQNKPNKPAHRRSGTHTIPRSPQKNRPAPAGPHRPTAARPPEMRRLCHQAESIQAPMGAADLCRDLYGR
ncbi:hypothetical protein SVTN_02255 [Streptomyces vietnamensis]|uniref:Lipoprotein n=2 Tax=Streptomyces vietnamensis TaxID=362257 RepID=A0A0B5I5A1_9ACTN|nr:hypothetical protein SVTN_02255 [Streptomyces vietnamensis]